jgi:glycolate oxidase FAD binding subunit
VAAGLSGPGRYRYGGVRDFILGVKFVDGRGEIVRGGGKVVKNSAGFDFPKLMVGSLGSLGVLVELTFKVFPKSPAHATIRAEYNTLADALDSFYRLYTARLEIDALDLVQQPDSFELLARLAGLPEALPARAERIRQLIGGDVITEDESLWREAREFAWVKQGWALIKVPLTPKRIPDLESRLGSTQTLRRYSAGCVGWVAVPDSPENMDGLLASLALPGLVVIGATPKPRIGYRNGQTFESRIKQTFDPSNRFPNL